MSSRCTLLALCAGLLVLSQSRVSAQSVWDTLNTNASANALGALGLFKNAVLLSGLQSTFSNASMSVTVLAPTDAALFAALPLMGLSQETLVQNAALMAPILLYHVFTPAVDSAALTAGAVTKTTLSPATTHALTLNKTGSTIKVTSYGTDAVVTTPDITAGSSVIHAIDTVLLPFYPTVLAALTRLETTSMLANVASIPGPAFVQLLANPLNEWTVFAPLNFAFTAYYASQNTSLAKLGTTPGAVQHLVSYHVVPRAIYSANITTTPMTVKTLTGQSLTLVKQGSSFVVVTPSGNATFQVYDVPAGFTNQATYRSVIHTIDKVLTPPPYTSVTEVLAQQNVTTLVTAITAEGSYASAVTGLSFRGTVFAPSDAAFTKALSASNLTLAQVAANSANLKKVLDLHVVPNVTFTVAGLTNGQTISTVSGANTLTVDKSVAGVTRIKSAQNSAIVITNEIPINNGQAVVIIVESVLLPANVTLTPASGTPGGAAAAVPSLTLLLSSIFAAVLLYMFHSQ